MEQITGAIFDMDGTILDSGHMWEEASVTLVRQMGCIPKESLQADALQLGMEEFPAFLKADYNMPQPLEEIREAMVALARAYYFGKARLKPGALDFLKRLKAAGVRTALATATGREYVEEALRRTGALPLFDAIFTCPEVGQGKHSPEIFRQAHRALGTAKASTWVFEDALYAIKTAREDGFPVCAVDDVGASFQMEEILKVASCRLPAFDRWPTLPFAAALM